jgi:RNA polymerase sigma-70 factor (ECF subfamily)
VLRPVVGADKVARLMLGGLVKLDMEMRMDPAQVNGHPALVIRLDGELDTVVAVRFDDGRITGLYAVRNPEKLTRMREEATLSR